MYIRYEGSLPLEAVFIDGMALTTIRTLQSAILAIISAFHSIFAN